MSIKLGFLLYLYYKEKLIIYFFKKSNCWQLQQVYATLLWGVVDVMQQTVAAVQDADVIFGHIYISKCQLTLFKLQISH